MKTLSFLVLVLVSRTVFAAEEQVTPAYDVTIQLNRDTGTVTFIPSVTKNGGIRRNSWIQIQPSTRLVLFRFREEAEGGRGTSLFVRVLLLSEGVPLTEGTLTWWDKEEKNSFASASTTVAMAPQALQLLDAVGRILLEEYAVPLLRGAEEVVTSEGSQAILRRFLATAIEELLAKKATAPQKTFLLRKEEAA